MVDGTPELRFDTLTGALRSLSASANEGRLLAAEIESAAKDAAQARWAWKRFLAKSVGSSAAGSSDKREAEAVASEAGGPLYEAHLLTEARLTAITERIRWSRAQVSGAMTATSVHKSELEALHVEAGLTDDR